MDTAVFSAPSREQLVHGLYEAAELEHNLMCTYLYAAFSLKDGVHEGLNQTEAEAVARWRRAILDVAIDEMGHLVAVWNITAALGAAPRLGRGNFPLDPGYLPAGVVVKLAPFNADVLQHFVHLERPKGSQEPDGAGFEIGRDFRRGLPGRWLTPMPTDYDTVGVFYEQLSEGLAAFVAMHGEAGALCGDPGLQMSPTEVDLGGAKRVICSKTAIAALETIIEQGEGASLDSEGSHFHKFRAIREEFAKLRAANPDFEPAFPAAANPVLRRPVVLPEGRVWLENADAIATVDLANSAYQMMLRLLAYSYAVSGPNPEKALAVDLGISLMRAATYLGERAARLPAGPSNPGCNAGMSFTTLRDSAALPPGAAARRFFVERLNDLSAAGRDLAASGDARAEKAARLLAALAERAERGFANLPETPAAALQRKAPSAAQAAPVPVKADDGFEEIDSDAMVLRYNAKLCIHARYCVTKAPNVFLANVEGPWIHPSEMDVENLASILRECPSGALAYRRRDGAPEEQPPLVNLLRVTEGGPYQVRAQIVLDGEPAGYRATLCRCGASKNKPFCDGSHHDIHFAASGEPETGARTAMLAVRDGPLAIDPQVDGPLQVRGNLEIISGTGRMVERVESARLCRCGHSNTKPYCDGTHAKVGFKSN